MNTKRNFYILFAIISLTLYTGCCLMSKKDKGDVPLCECTNNWINNFKNKSFTYEDSVGNIAEYKFEIESDYFLKQQIDCDDCCYSYNLEHHYLNFKSSTLPYTMQFYGYTQERVNGCLWDILVIKMDNVEIKKIFCQNGSEQYENYWCEEYKNEKAINPDQADLKLEAFEYADTIKLNNHLFI
ncbi:MAG: hypothetical protein HY738_00975, partial [Bacteroidia bacterium]|nr:hypothetical protein [Bacteroidia bacterium]